MKWRGNRQTTWKRIQNNASKVDQEPENKMEKMKESTNKNIEVQINEEEIGKLC